MRPAANPIQRVAQEIELDIQRKQKEILKMRRARRALTAIMADLNGFPGRPLKKRKKA